MVNKATKANRSATAMERKWQAESDCRILADAKTIMGDPNRMKMAANAAKSMMADKQKELQGLKQVARKAK